ncbi:MAG: tRNA lysidine(34) synthetase TilS [Clostridiales bacterium]|jgi:tRNA(Ile)-lysidine synthase|nr:tRNA lysidine(34) synthetase TilS [Clostridiales bacterium]
MRKQVNAAIAKYNMLARGDGVVVGLSGGADSVAMTHFLCNEIGLKIACVHIHHGLRGREADEDAQFCEDFCRHLGIDLVIFREDAAAEARKMGVGVEEAGRVLRYKHFNKVLAQRGFDKIAVAHNKNDADETIIMQIVRGAGGIRGISPKNGNVIRPLIDVSREEILAYCARHGLAHRVDSTNDSNDYTRNWVRNFLLPQIRDNLNPGVGDALRRLAEISCDEDAFLGNITKNAYSNCVNSGDIGMCINLDALSQYDMAIKRRIVRAAIGEALGGPKDITFDHVEAVLALAGLQSGKRASLPKGFVAERAYNEICIKIPDVFNNFSVTLPRDNPVFVSQIDTWVHLGDAIVRENAFTKALDCDKITNVLIRTRLPGDRIFFNNVGTKKVKDFFIDKKIARKYREQAVFIACDRDIILIIGGAPGHDAPIESHKFDAKNHDKKIYLQIWNN